MAQGKNPGPSMPSAAGQSQPMSTDMAKPAVAAGPLKITFGDKSAEWTPATLAALPHKTITVYNEHAKASQTYSGVELIDLLKPLGVAEKPHGKDFRLYLVAEGSDGYQVVYSMGEVTPDVHDATVMVADTMDGKPIAASGPLQLVATGEKRPARWVRNLVAIRVRTAE
ncbi:MAG TPA: molybdopterin-dependent oxidoreductase [Terracidiphilus sp.]